MNLLQNRDSMPNMTRADVYGHLRNSRCGSNGSQPLVNCPEVEGTVSDNEYSYGHPKPLLTI